MIDRGELFLVEASLQVVPRKRRYCGFVTPAIKERLQRVARHEDASACGNSGDDHCGSGTGIAKDDFYLTKVRYGKIIRLPMLTSTGNHTGSVVTFWMHRI